MAEHLAIPFLPEHNEEEWDIVFERGWEVPKGESLIAVYANIDINPPHCGREEVIETQVFNFRAENFNPEIIQKNRHQIQYLCQLYGVVAPNFVLGQENDVASWGNFFTGLVRSSGNNNFCDYETMWRFCSTKTDYDAILAKAKPPENADGCCDMLPEGELGGHWHGGWEGGNKGRILLMLALCGHKRAIQTLLVLANETGEPSVGPKKYEELGGRAIQEYVNETNPENREEATIQAIYTIARSRLEQAQILKEQGEVKEYTNMVDRYKEPISIALQAAATGEVTETEEDSLNKILSAEFIGFAKFTKPSTDAEVNTANKQATEELIQFAKTTRTSLTSLPESTALQYLQRMHREPLGQEQVLMLQQKIQEVTISTLTHSEIAYILTSAFLIRSRPEPEGEIVPLTPYESRILELATELGTSSGYYFVNNQNAESGAHALGYHGSFVKGANGVAFDVCGGCSHGLDAQLNQMRSALSRFTPSAARGPSITPPPVARMPPIIIIPPPHFFQPRAHPSPDATPKKPTLVRLDTPNIPKPLDRRAPQTFSTTAEKRPVRKPKRALRQTPLSRNETQNRSPVVPLVTPVRHSGVTREAYPQLKSSTSRLSPPKSAPRPRQALARVRPPLDAPLQPHAPRKDSQVLPAKSKEPVPVGRETQNFRLIIERAWSAIRLAERVVTEKSSAPNKLRAPVSLQIDLVKKTIDVPPHQALETLTLSLIQTTRALWSWQPEYKITNSAIPKAKNLHSVVSRTPDLIVRKSSAGDEPYQKEPPRGPTYLTPDTYQRGQTTNKIKEEITVGDRLKTALSKLDMATSPHKNERRSNTHLTGQSNIVAANNLEQETVTHKQEGATNSSREVHEQVREQSETIQAASEVLEEERQDLHIEPNVVTRHDATTQNNNPLKIASSEERGEAQVAERAASNQTLIPANPKPKKTKTTNVRALSIAIEPGELRPDNAFWAAREIRKVYDRYYHAA